MPKGHLSNAQGSRQRMKKHWITYDISTIPLDGEEKLDEEVPLWDRLGVPDKSGVEAQLSNMAN